MSYAPITTRYPGEPIRSSDVNQLNDNDAYLKNALEQEIENNASKFGGVDANRMAKMQSQIEAAEQKLLEQEMELTYLMGRYSSRSDWMMEPFFDTMFTDPDYYTEQTKPAQIMDENDWNNNWKSVNDSESRLDFKNGFMRPSQVPYYMEVIDEYNLNNVGQLYKGALSKYDSVNECYWLISNAGANALGEITKLGKNLIDNKVDVLGRWYLALNAAGTWTGIAVNALGTQIVIVMSASAASYVYKINITAGLLGVAATKSNDTIYKIDATCDYTNTSVDVACDSTADLRVGQYLYAATCVPTGAYIASITDATHFKMNAGATGTTANVSTIITDASLRYTDTTASSSIVDITYYSTTEWCYILNNAATATTLKFLKIADLTAGTTTAITGFAQFFFGTDATNLGKAIVFDGTNMWVKINDIATNQRFIYKFNLSTDVVSNVVIKHSGRFETFGDYDRDASANEGISISPEGDILEVVSNANPMKLISRRAIRNALWAENQISGETLKLTITAPTTPTMVMVDANGDYWTADWNIAVNTAKMYRYQLSTGTVASVTFTTLGLGNNSLIDATVNGDDVYIIVYYATGTIYRVLKGTVTSLIANLGGSIILGTTAGWAYLTNPTNANTDSLRGITYCSDLGNLLLLNDTDDKIDTLTLDGNTWTQAVYDLPAPTSLWNGIAYKNQNIYVSDWTAAVAPNRIYVLPLLKQTAAAWYFAHQYQDPSTQPSMLAIGRTFIDFDSSGNLITYNQTTTRFIKMKTLEDPDVMQLHTYMNSSNILLSNAVSALSPITERYFDPEDFADIRDCPDKKYMVVGYSDNGFSELHLDEYLSGKSTTGKDRYDVTKIRTRHYAEGANNITGIAAALTSAVFVEKDMIFACDSTGYFKMIDLKSGKATIFYTGVSTGKVYNGTLTQRNDGKTYIGTLNAELNLGSASNYCINGKTFTKTDESNYLYKYPKTYIGIAGTVGIDLLVIDWDANNNRTPVKVFNNLFSDASLQYGVFIAPSGYLFGADYVASGLIWKGLKPVWDVAEDADYINTAPTRAMSYSASNNGYNHSISPNSLCWKTTSGTWRHLLTCATAETASTTYVLDCENNTKVNITTVAATWGYASIDNYEDRVFYPAHLQTLAGSLQDFRILKRLRFKDYYNTAIPTTGPLNHDGWTSEITHWMSRPRYNSAFRYVNGDGLYATFDTKFSPLVNQLAFGSLLFGLVMYNFYNEDQCTHKSIDFEIDSSSSYIYKSIVKI